MLLEGNSIAIPLPLILVLVVPQFNIKYAHSSSLRISFQLPSYADHSG